MAEHELNARVLTPEGEVFTGEVEQLSTRTAVGEIGILANHVPVLARLLPTELRLHMADGEVRRWAQAEGWLQVFANRATVLVGDPAGEPRHGRVAQPDRGCRRPAARVRAGLGRPPAGGKGQGACRGVPGSSRRRELKAGCRVHRGLIAVPTIGTWTSLPSPSG